MASLIVENGTGVANANSYATLAALRAYNDQRGVVLPDDDDVVMQQSFLAMDFLASYGPRWKGNRALPLIQVLDWPRERVRVYGVDLAVDGIPPAIIAAQCYLVGIATTVELLPVIDQRAIVKDKLGPLETDYETSYGALLRPIIPNLESILAPYMNPGIGGIASVRL